MDHYLFLGEDRWGPIDRDGARIFSEVNRTIYECGECSAEGIVVYHNVVGTHRHATKEQLKEFLLYLKYIS